MKKSKFGLFVGWLKKSSLFNINHGNDQYKRANVISAESHDFKFDHVDSIRKSLGTS